MKRTTVSATIIILLVLGAFLFVNFFYNVKETKSGLIVRDIRQLTDIFNRIHAACTIRSFDGIKNTINFLNVKAFEGSEVGPINLAYPDKWEGPYVSDNPTIDGKEYQVVKEKDGYYILPGDGVTLPNGSVVGRDITIDEDADISKLVSDKNKLLYKGQIFAGRIDLT